MIDRKIYIPQVDEMDCGVAALAMILKHYGSSASLAYLRNEACSYPSIWYINF